MLEQELTLLRETEGKCRDILERARADAAVILADARADADRRYAEELRDTCAGCEAALAQTREDIAANRDRRMAKYEQETRTDALEASRRVDAVLRRILEGMWEDGNCTDDRVRPDGAGGV